MLAVVLALLLLASRKCLAMKNQSVEIQGRFRCGEDVPRNATIELWNENLPLLTFISHYILNEETKFPDNKLDTTHPDDLGNFTIRATSTKIFGLSLYLVVYHQCDGVHYSDSQNRKEVVVFAYMKEIFICVM
ncbi:unnamed protein product [Gongylonema pulchrum]|uniref:Transthyretin-like family protein n=1 Tax=Gongylonema pulchrum TaxID=637853 RepID=A0A183D1N4_9BILA|nr:unnamed protein product [Gongylonema pulchrum]